MKTIYLEIFAAEGGDDSKLLVEKHLNSYMKVCSKNCL